jgi:hypothetical protein
MNMNMVAVPLQAWSGPEGSRKFRFHRPGVAQRVPGSSGSTGLDWPRGFQEVQVPQAWSGPEGSRKFRFHMPGVAQRVPGSSGSTGLEIGRASCRERESVKV